MQPLWVCLISKCFNSVAIVCVCERDSVLKSCVKWNDKTSIFTQTGCDELLTVSIVRPRNPSTWQCPSMILGTRDYGKTFIFALLYTRLEHCLADLLHVDPDVTRPVFSATGHTTAVMLFTRVGTGQVLRYVKA